jgi:hypothetical protein
MVISEKNKILINRVVDTIDWTLIHKFYKLVGRSVANETTQIPGLKKLDKGTKLKEDHIKEEVNLLINHMIMNDISQFIYGPWNFVWVNGEWEMEIPAEDENGNFIEGKDMFMPILESVLEVYFSPMVVISKELVIDNILSKAESKEGIDLQGRLDKAIKDENYELASKLRDLIEIYKKQK